MNTESRTIVEFCRILARVRGQFREAHIMAENSQKFSDVSCTVSHSEKDLLNGNVREESVEVSFSLDSELREGTRDSRYSLGASVGIYNVSGLWKCHGDVGWSVLESGWEDFRTVEAEFASLEELRNELPSLVSRLLRDYEDLIDFHFRTSFEGPKHER